MVERVKISFLNSEEAIVEDISKMFMAESRSVFIDFVHYSHFGNCRIAEVIASKIRNNSSELVDTLCE